MQVSQGPVSLFPLNPASDGAKKWFWESPQDTSSLIQAQPP